jgi:hypothetical protein
MDSLMFHCWGRGRYDSRQVRRTSYRPRPNNGSGDSPRPPFLTEFVNRIGKSFLVETIYHLIGGQLAMWIHPHVERSFRLKTESAVGVVQLQTAYAQVSQHSVRSRRRHPLADLGKTAVQQRDARPVIP